eukprot:9503635-Pyramimonas_sp.AAC.1
MSHPSSSLFGPATILFEGQVAVGVVLVEDGYFECVADVVRNAELVGANFGGEVRGEGVNAVGGGLDVLFVQAIVLAQGEVQDALGRSALESTQAEFGGDVPLEVAELPTGVLVQRRLLRAVVEANQTLIQNVQHTDEPDERHDVRLVDVVLERAHKARGGHDRRE